MLNLAVTEDASRIKVRRNQTGTTAFIEKTRVYASIKLRRPYNEAIGRRILHHARGLEPV